MSTPTQARGQKVTGKNASQEIMERVMSYADIAIWSHDLSNNAATFGTSGGERIYGYSHQEFEADPHLWQKAIHPEDRPYVNISSLTESFPIHSQYRIVRKDGQIRWVENYLYPQFDAKGVPVRLDGITIDVTRHKRAEEQLHKMAYRDPLTGMPNRQQFEEDLAFSITDAARSAESFAVLFIDFDAFKYINDTFGHHCGDTVLKQAAARILECGSNDDNVRLYRIGGDEFTAIVRNASSVDDVTNFSSHLLRQFEKPIRFGDTDIYAKCSIGAAIFPDHGDNVDTLLRRADIAMYSAKEAGGYRTFVYSSELSSNYRENLRLYDALTTALREQEFELYFQPKIEMTTGRISGVEVLTRWQTRGNGTIGPKGFIPFAEHSGLIWEIGGWILENACRQNQIWQEAGLPPIPISVNVSTVQLEHPNFMTLLEDILERTKLPPQFLELEISESVLVKNMESVSGVIERISSLGVRICLDDFGVGYSSMQYLAQLSVDAIKIDHAFIDGLASNRKTVHIVSGLVHLAHPLGIRVGAEGIEQGDQVEILKDIGCDEMQGYLIFLPQKKDAFEAYYREMAGRE